MKKIKTRTYTILTGDYEDLQVVDRIEGPATPALSTLLKQFKEKYEYNYDTKYYPLYTLEDLKKADMIERERLSCIERMKNDGLVGKNLAELFIHWCIREHKFKTIDKDTFYV